MREAATGVILAGGKSARMGREKALLPLKGQPLIAHVFQALRPLTQEVLIVTDDARKFAGWDAMIVEDLIPGAHALGGLYTGLRFAAHDRCFVVACDAPVLVPAFIRFLLCQEGDYDAIVPRGRQGLQPLHAVYRKTCLPAIEHQLRARQWELHAVLSQVRTCVIAPHLVHRFDPEERSFQNLNTPAEFARACAQQEQDDHAWLCPEF